MVLVELVVVALQEPVAANNDEVKDVSIEGAVDVVLKIKGLLDTLEDRDADRVDSGRRVIFVAEGLEERSE